MNRTEYMLACIAEECNEAGQRAIKAMRFGLRDVQKGQELDNAQRLRRELWDLRCVLDMCAAHGIFDELPDEDVVEIELLGDHYTDKHYRLLEYMKYARNKGTLDPCEHVFNTLVKPPYCTHCGEQG